MVAHQYIKRVWGLNLLKELPGRRDGLSAVYLSVQGMSWRKSTNDGASVPVLRADPMAPWYWLMTLPYWPPQYCRCMGDDNAAEVWPWKGAELKYAIAGEASSWNVFQSPSQSSMI